MSCERSTQAEKKIFFKQNERKIHGVYKTFFFDFFISSLLSFHKKKYDDDDDD
jgi:hypothetical protein